MIALKKPTTEWHPSTHANVGLWPKPEADPRAGKLILIGRFG